MENLKQSISNKKNIIMGAALLLIGLVIGLAIGAAVVGKISHRMGFSRDGMMNMRNMHYKGNPGNYNPDNNQWNNDGRQTMNGRGMMGNYNNNPAATGTPSNSQMQPQPASATNSPSVMYR